MSAAAPPAIVAPPPGAPRFALIDSVRGIAVLFILAFHVASITGAINSAVVGRCILAMGNQALIMFFVLSAFLLYRPFVAARAADRPMPSARRYGRRRVLRILPAYWVALTVLGVFPGIAGVFTGDWWRFYGFLQLYSPRTIGQGIPPAWSLCVEVTFYLLLPLWALLLRRLPRRGGWVRWELRTLGGVALLGALLQVLAARQIVDSRVAQALPGQMTWLALGMALAVWSVWESRAHRPSRVARLVADHGWACWAGAVAAIAGLTALVHAGGLFGLVVALRSKQAYATVIPSIALTAILATLTVLPAVFGEERPGLPQRVLRLRPLALIGLVSYGIYLYHLAVAQLLGLRTDPSHFSATGLGLAGRVHHLTTPVLFVLTLAGSAALAGLSYRVVERPLLRRKEPAAQRLSSSASATP